MGIAHMVYSMARDASPIDVGSTWKYDDEDGGDPRTFEIVNIHIDEDNVPQLKVCYDSHEPDHLVDIESFREREREGKLERTNTGHEAWENRQ